MNTKWTIWFRWSLANAGGLLLGLALHQGLPRDAMPPMPVPSSIRPLLEPFGLSAAALALCFLQQIALRLFVRVCWPDIVLQTGLAASAFWISYSAGNMPFSHAAILATLGALTGWSLRRRSGEWRRLMWLSSGGFFAATMAGFAGSCGLLPDRLYLHIAAWTYLGYFAGVASSALTGWQLARSLRSVYTGDARCPEAGSLNLLLGR